MKDIETTYGKATFIEAGGNTGADIQLERIEIFDSFKGKGKAYDLVSEIHKAAIEEGISMMEAYIMPDEDDGNIEKEDLIAFMEANGWEQYDEDMMIKEF